MTRYYYYHRADYVEALKWFRKCAGQQSCDTYTSSARRGVEHILGNMYYKGVGVSQDYTEATKWFIRAAKDGMSGLDTELKILANKGIADAKACFDSKGKYLYKKLFD